MFDPRSQSQVRLNTPPPDVEKLEYAGMYPFYIRERGEGERRQRQRGREGWRETERQRGRERQREKERGELGYSKHLVIVFYFS